MKKESVIRYYIMLFWELC